MARGGLRVRGKRVYARVRYGNDERLEECGNRTIVNAQIGAS